MVPESGARSGRCRKAVLGVWGLRQSSLTNDRGGTEGGRKFLATPGIEPALLRLTFRSDTASTEL